MRINELGFVVIMVEGAPLSLEEEDVEVVIFLVVLEHIVQQSDFDVLHSVSK